MFVKGFLAIFYIYFDDIYKKLYRYKFICF